MVRELGEGVEQPGFLEAGGFVGESKLAGNLLRADEEPRLPLLSA